MGMDASSFTYAEATWSQKLPYWIAVSQVKSIPLSHFAYGVAADGQYNIKTGVIKVGFTRGDDQPDLR